MTTILQKGMLTAGQAVARDSIVLLPPAFGLAKFASAEAAAIQRLFAHYAPPFAPGRMPE